MKTLLKSLLVFGLFVFGLVIFNQANQADAAPKCPTAVKASHILVDTKEQADALEKKLENGISFEYLAQKYSKCPSGQEGGDLGFFRRGKMVKEFEDAAFSMEPGEVSHPFQSQFGWHILKVTDVR